MSIFVTIGDWFLQQLLMFLYSKASKAVEQAVAQRLKDEERGVVNAENLKAYESAVDRAERISAAVKLLSRKR